MCLLQAISIFLELVLVELSLKLKIDLLVFRSYRAIKPSPPAEARIWGTSLFHETDVM